MDPPPDGRRAQGMSVRRARAGGRVVVTTVFGVLANRRSVPRFHGLNDTPPTPSNATTGLHQGGGHEDRGGAAHALPDRRREDGLQGPSSLFDRVRVPTPVTGSIRRGLGSWKRDRRHRRRSVAHPHRPTPTPAHHTQTRTTAQGEEQYNWTAHRSRGYGVGSLNQAHGEPDKYWKQPGHPLNKEPTKAGRFEVGVWMGGGSGCGCGCGWMG